MNIKDYREKELKYYVLGIILLIYLLDYPDFDVLFTQNSNLVVSFISSVGSNLFLGVIYVFSFVLDSIIGSKLKDFFIYFNGDKPGEYVFSDIKKVIKDNRIRIDEFNSKYNKIIKKLPKDDKERKSYEDSKWYQIFCKYEGKSKILALHREYLLCRDLTAITIAIAVLYLLFSVISIVMFNWNVCITLFVFYVLLNISTRSKAKQFVGTVIAVDIASK